MSPLFTRTAILAGKYALAASLSFAVLLPSSGRAATLSYDDGTFEFGLGLGSSGGTLTYANRFTAPIGGFNVQSISIAFADPFAVEGRPSNNGTPFRAALWRDPNGDANPSDAVLVSFLDSIVLGATESNPNVNAVFATYDIPDITFTAGQSFFVGGIITLNGSLFQSPASVDTSASDNASFLAFGNGWGGGAFALNDISPFPGDFLIRANGVTPVAVPEATTLALAFPALCVIGTMFAGKHAVAIRRLKK
jgi:hypothetical protein